MPEHVTSAANPTVWIGGAKLEILNLPWDFVFTTALQLQFLYPRREFWQISHPHRFIIPTFSFNVLRLLLTWLPNIPANMSDMSCPPIASWIGWQELQL